MNQMLRGVMLSLLLSAAPAAQLCGREAKAVDASVTRKTCCCPGPRGLQGPKGFVGLQGLTGDPGILGYAEYVFVSDSPDFDLTPNDALTIPTRIVDTIGLTLNNGHNGTVFTFPEGVYVLDYETAVQPSNDDTFPVNGVTLAVYHWDGTTALQMDPQSLAGNNVGTNFENIDWVHGRHIISIPELNAGNRRDVYIGSVVGTEVDLGGIPVVIDSADTVRYIIRLTVLKLSDTPYVPEP